MNPRDVTFTNLFAANHSILMRYIEEGTVAYVELYIVNNKAPFTVPDSIPYIYGTNKILDENVDRHSRMHAYFFFSRNGFTAEEILEGRYDWPWDTEFFIMLNDEFRVEVRVLFGFSELKIKGSLESHTETPAEMKECYICLEEEEEFIALNICKHQFHFDCIKMWFKEQNFCPVCQQAY